MEDNFSILDAVGAQEFLQALPAQSRKRGLSCFRAGQVFEILEEARNMQYSARVRDGETYSVTLSHDPTEGTWQGDCTCAQEADCEHVFAAMSALIAEHRFAKVRNLSSGLDRAGAPPTQGKPEERSGELARRLAIAVDRRLTNEEKQFVLGIEKVFERCRRTRQITVWDLSQIGLPIDDTKWDGKHIWPAFPVNDHEFWLYIAHAVRANGGTLPEFMLPVTDLTVVEERLSRWKRSLEIENWKHALSNLQLYSDSTQPAKSGDADMRLVIGPTELRVQWRRPGELEFGWLRQAHLRQFNEDYNNGSLRLPAEAGLLWQLMERHLDYRLTHSLRYLGADVTRTLRRVLGSKILESRVVNDEGKALARPAEPLRWEVSAAESHDDDYCLRLVQADGSPLRELCCTVEGVPAYYVTSQAVYEGPPKAHGMLDAGKENRIPAQALERATGVLFLQSLGLELPPRLRERVRLIPYETVIRCELRRSWRGTDSEDCIITVVAETALGHQQTWTGYNWVHSGQHETRQKRESQNEITVFDSATLRRVPPLLEPLRLKPSEYGNLSLSMRVTRKFPEIFGPWLKSLPPDIKVQLAGDLASFATADVAGKVKLDVSEIEIDWFDLRVVLNVTDTTLSKEEIGLLLAAKGGYVRLKGKGWRRLQFDLTEEENERLARLGLNPRELSAEPQRLHALQLADDAAKKFLPSQQVEQIHRRASEIKARVAPSLPSGVTAELRPYQLEGFHFLAYLAANRFGGILADDMGLGKTLQTLAWLLWLNGGATGARANPQANNSKIEFRVPEPPALPADSRITSNGTPARTLEKPEPRPEFAPSLVVCPKSVMDNWRGEASRFTPSLRVKVWPPSELGGFHRGLNDADLHVLNYSQVRMMGESLLPVRWRAVILDEGQYIKNPNSQTAQVARALRAEHRLVLSGTPIENRLLDLWSLMAFTMPGVLSSRHNFAKLYDAKGDPFARRRLAARVRPFILRRTKAQVAKDLPDRIEEDLFCEIEGEQQTLYRAELKRAQQLLLGISTQKELAKQQFHFLVSLLRLRQICCHPKLVNAESTALSAKSEALMEQLEPLMEEGYKVLVFSQFVEMLELLRQPIEARGWPVFYLAGETENRGELVQKFQSAAGPGVFLISLKAGGFGLNLTAASYVVLFDPWWNPAVENQAIDRTHRIGQVNKVIAYRLLIKNSIEEKIRELQKKKKALAEDVLGEEKFSQSLTLDDLRFLFSD